jgi:hypothetical protein
MTRISVRGARLLGARGEELVQSSCRASGRPGRSSGRQRLSLVAGRSGRSSRLPGAMELGGAVAPRAEARRGGLAWRRRLDGRRLRLALMRGVGGG